MNIKAFVVALAATCFATAGVAQEVTEEDDDDDEIVALPTDGGAVNPLDELLGTGVGTAVGVGVGVVVLAIAISDDDSSSSTTTGD